MAQSHVKYLLIDSADRSSGTSTDFKVQINPPINGINKIELFSISMPNTAYNINESNNFIYFTEDIDIAQELFPGNYNINTLLEAIGSRMTTASNVESTYVATYNPTTMKITVTSGGNWKFNFGNQITNSIASILGYANVTPGSLSDHWEAENVVQLHKPLVYFIDIAQLPVSCKSTNTDFATFAITSTTVGSQIEYFHQNERYPIIETYNHQNVYELSIKVKSRGNRIVDLNGAEWSLQLRLHY